MKRTWITVLIFIMVGATYSYSQGMMGRGMMGADLKRWLDGEEAAVRFTGEKPLESEKHIEAGQRIYQQRCAACHGQKGDGNGPNSEYLVVKPTDFTSGLYKFRSTPSGSIPADEDIYRTISRGIRGTAMLPWFDLSEKEKWYVTYYIKTLSDRFDEEEADNSVTVPESDIDKTALVNKGRSVYQQAKCWECHGNEGRGDGPKAGDLKDDWGRSVMPTDLTGKPLKRGSSEHDIYMTLATGLDGTPMASYIDSIPPQNMNALSFYVKSLGRKWYSRFWRRRDITPDERVGMMTYHHGGPNGMMHGRDMGRRMMPWQ